MASETELPVETSLTHFGVDEKHTANADDTPCPAVTSPPAPSHHASVPSVPTLRPGKDMAAGITASSTHLGQLSAARRATGTTPRPMASISGSNGGLNPAILAKMKEFSLSRQGAPSVGGHSVSTGSIPTNGQWSAGQTSPPSGALAMPMGGALAAGARAKPTITKDWASSPSVSGSMSSPASPRQGPARKKPGFKLSDVTGSTGSPGDGNGTGNGSNGGETAFSKYSEFIDTKSGTLNFKNKAILHSSGVEFSSGHKFSISLDEVDRLDELGKGNYGTVYKVRHSRPHMRKPGQGLRGIVSREEASANSSPTVKPQDGNLTGIIMAMKEIRLELDENKFAQIIMELDILHRCVSPFIIDFYGAFFQEGAVYMCIEYMDGGSVDKLYQGGVAEDILRKIVLSTVMGLKTLKDEHNIIHRDVKPTNILVNTRGQVKICDFGVSGNLVASIAKTNIGCQSYMAPERIAGGGVQSAGATGGGTYSVQSDIWSLGLTIIECAKGRYPYPPETFNNIFSQLHAIVHGDPPTLPESGYSDDAHSFVSACLNKNPKNRPSYATLLRHPWMAPLMQPPQTSEASNEVTPADGQSTDIPSPRDTEDEEIAAWVAERLERRKGGEIGDVQKPALHAVALDAVPGSSPPLEDAESLSVQA